MPPKDAYVMKNWVPGTATVDARNGNTLHSSDPIGDPSPVETLFVYAGGSSPKMLAAGGEYIYDVTVAAPVQLQTGRVGAQIVHTMFSNAGDQFLIGCSGQDVPFSYDGAAVANLTMTGTDVVPASLNFPFTFKGRLFFLQDDMLGFFYLPVGQIQGALDYYDLSQVAQLGGYVVAITSFSLSDSGQSPQDYCLFITSEGEYIVYGGFDPSSATDWGIVGRYYGPPPIGRRCTLNYGTDIVILTLEGALPFSEIRKVRDANDERNAITSKLGKYLSDLNGNADVWGWQALAYARSGWLLLNVPTEGSIAGGYTQFVMNTGTGAWTQFTGWDGICFCVFGRRLYFGTNDGNVYLADDGRHDNDVDIPLECKQAYNVLEDGFGSGELNKLFHFAILTVASEGEPAVSGELSVDYREEIPGFAVPLADSGGAEWDVALWDLAMWETGEFTQTVTLSLGRYGTAASLFLRVSLSGIGLKWYTTKFVYEKARGLL